VYGEVVGERVGLRQARAGERGFRVLARGRAVANVEQPRHRVANAGT